MINKCVLISHTGSDPEIVSTTNGKVAKLRLATSEKYKDKNGQIVTTTEWHHIVGWNQLADICEKYVKKGELLYVEGKIKTRSYDNKDGVKVYVTEIVADTMKMLGGKKEESEPKPVASG